jgi:hypothetical protein
MLCVACAWAESVTTNSGV